jgi:hypothetical protein
MISRDCLPSKARCGNAVPVFVITAPLSWSTSVWSPALAGLGIGETLRAALNMKPN